MSAQLALGAAVLYAGIVSFSIISKFGLQLLWTYHPLAASAFFVSAVAALNAVHAATKGGAGKHKVLVNRHNLFMVAALLFALATTGVIYVNKEQKGRPHLTSYHGQLGAATTLIWVMLSFSGAAIWYLPGAVTKYTPLRQAYVQHGMGGTVASIMLFATHVLALAGAYQGFRQWTAGWWTLASLLALTALPMIVAARRTFNRAARVLAGSPAAAMAAKVQ